MKRKCFFKMVVISSVLLITGGILIACGKVKEEATTEVITEITTEVSTEVLSERSIELNGYKFVIPDNFEIESQEKDMLIYMKDDTTLSIISNDVEDIDKVNENYLHLIMQKDWLMDGGTELEYQYAEKDFIKNCLYIVAYTMNNEHFIQYVVCYVDYKTNKITSMVVFDKCISEEDLDTSFDVLKEVYGNFEKLNF